MNTTSTTNEIKCRFAFLWTGIAPTPMPMYHLEQDIPGHPIGSTVTEHSITRVGGMVPEVQKQAALQAIKNLAKL